MQRVLTIARISLAALSGAAGIALAVLAFRAQFGGNDYFERRSANWRYGQAEGEETWPWYKRQWGFHIRANPDGIVCFGNQPFWGYRVGRSPLNDFSVRISYWLLLPLCAVMPIYAVVRYAYERRRQRRQSLGLCPQCGYDLRASPDRCPECGTPTSR